MIFGNVSTFYTILRVTPGEKYQRISSFKKPALQNMLKICVQEWYYINRYKIPWSEGLGSPTAVQLAYKFRIVSDTRQLTVPLEVLQRCWCRYQTTSTGKYIPIFLRRILCLLALKMEELLNWQHGVTSHNLDRHDSSFFYGAVTRAQHSFPLHSFLLLYHHHY